MPPKTISSRLGCCARHGDRVPIAFQAGGNPQHIDLGDRLGIPGRDRRVGHREFSYEPVLHGYSTAQYAETGILQSIGVNLLDCVCPIADSAYFIGKCEACFVLK